jgi:hypothetical protein
MHQSERGAGMPDEVDAIGERSDATTVRDRIDGP